MVAKFTFGVFYVFLPPQCGEGFSKRVVSTKVYLLYIELERGETENSLSESGVDTKTDTCTYTYLHTYTYEEAATIRRRRSARLDSARLWLGSARS